MEAKGNTQQGKDTQVPCQRRRRYMEEQPAAGEIPQEETMQDEIDVDRFGDGFNRRPDHIPAPVWKQVKQLHRLLGHPWNATLVKLLQRWKASEEAIGGKKALERSACRETKTKATVRHVQPHRAETFNVRIYTDVFEVKLSGESNMLLVMIVDDAPSTVSCHSL